VVEMEVIIMTLDGVMPGTGKAGVVVLAEKPTERNDMFGVGVKNPLRPTR